MANQVSNLLYDYELDYLRNLQHKRAGAFVVIHPSIGCVVSRLFRYSDSTQVYPSLIVHILSDSHIKVPICSIRGKSRCPGELLEAQRPTSSRLILQSMSLTLEWIYETH